MEVWGVLFVFSVTYLSKNTKLNAEEEAMTPL